MPKRFTDSQIWSDSWFRKLPTKYKEVWRYLYENCDMSGAWKVDIEALEFFISGETFTEDQILSHINNGKERIVVFNGGGHWMISEFVQFQYGVLSELSSTHRGVFKVLKRHFEKGLPKGYPTIKAKAKDKAKDKEGGVGETNPSFDVFWESYPRKVAKKKAFEIWKRINPPKSLIEKIIRSLTEFKKSDQWIKDGGRFIPHPATWLNQERWTDDIESQPESVVDRVRRAVERAK